MEPEDLARRDVSWDPASGTLTVGGRSVAVPRDDEGNEALLRTYLDLVADLRDVTLDGGVALRRDDVIVLAELLDLDDADLERQLREILHLSAREAAELHRRLRRQRLATAALGVGMLAAGMPLGTALADATHGGGEATETTTTTAAAAADDPGAPVTVTVPPAPATTTPPPAVDDPIGDPIPDPVVPADAPTASDAPGSEVQVLAAAIEVPDEGDEAGTDVGYSVVYERDPDFVPPPGVDIGESLLIERDAPPGGD